APNDERQFHKVEVEAKDVKDLFRREFRIAEGDGPPLEVFIPPGEATARFAWQDEDGSCRETMKKVLGLVQPAPQQGNQGQQGQQVPGQQSQEDEMKGFILINEERHLDNHAMSVAAELLAPYADNLQGTVATVPTQDMRVVGNMSGAVLSIG